MAQWPYILPETLTFSAAAGDDQTLRWVVAVFGIALIAVIPSLALLYWLDQRGPDFQLPQDVNPTPGRPRGAPASWTT